LAVIGQRQQANDLRTGGSHIAHAADKLGLVSAFEQVGNEDEQRFLRVFDELLAVSHALVDVGSATELHAEDHAHGIVPALLGQVHNFGIERNHSSFESWQARKD